MQKLPQVDDLGKRQRYGDTIITFCAPRITSALYKWPDGVQTREVLPDTQDAITLSRGSVKVQVLRRGSPAHLQMTSKLDDIKQQLALKRAELNAQLEEQLGKEMAVAGQMAGLSGADIPPARHDVGDPGGPIEGCVSAETVHFDCGLCSSDLGGPTHTGAQSRLDVHRQGKTHKNNLAAWRKANGVKRAA